MQRLQNSLFRLARRTCATGSHLTWNKRAIRSTSIITRDARTTTLPLLASGTDASSLRQSQRHLAPSVKFHNVYKAFCRSFSTQLDVPPRVTGLYDYIATGLQDMVEDNPGLAVNIAGSNMTITLPNDQGQYIFHYTETIPAKKAKVPGTGEPSPIDLHVVVLQSPVSASAYKYTFCPANLWWTSMDAGAPHLLLELLTRELMKVCKGYPNF